MFLDGRVDGDIGRSSTEDDVELTVELTFCEVCEDKGSAELLSDVITGFGFVESGSCGKGRRPVPEFALVPEREAGKPGLVGGMCDSRRI